MRRVIVSMNISTDGFMASDDGALDWQFNYWTADMARLLGEQLNAADTILLGRNTYNAMASYWPMAGCGADLSRDDLAYATMMNNHNKVVCSNTLKTARWQNTQIINGDICAQITNLKKQPGKDILVYGSHTLVQYLNQAQLIDEYRLWIYPVTLGSGMPLFTNNLWLHLLRSQHFSSGVILLEYAFNHGQLSYIT